MTSPHRLATTSRLRDVVAPLVLGLVLVIGWAVASGGIDPLLLPSPAAVATSLGALLASPSFYPYLGQTAAAAAGGSLLGILVAVPLGVGLHRSRWAAAALNPYLGASQSIPAIAVAPLLVLWLGYGVGAIGVLCALMVFFPIVIATVVGLRHVEAGLVDAALLDGAGSWQRLRHIEFPLALPQVLAGIRNGVALSVTGAVVGEMVMGGHGLGTLLTVQRDSVNTAAMVATIVVLCALASLAYLAVRVLEGAAEHHVGLPTNDRKAR